MKEALMTIAIAAAAVGLLFGAAIFHFQWNASSTTEEDLGPIENRPVVPYTPLTQAERFNGMAIQLHNRNHLALFKKAINQIADLGANTVELSVAAYQENGSSSTIAIGAHNAPTKQEMEDLVKTARSRGLRVIVMPIVLLDAPRGTEWRGRIIPTDSDRWWADYQEYIVYYAEAVSNAGGGLFMVGSELNKMETSTSRWRKLIKFLRDKYPNLKLGYSANWDRYWKIAFWKDLDFAGCTSYYTLADHEEPTVDEVVKAWDRFEDKYGTTYEYKKKLIAWQKTIGKPVIFTEAGWASQKGAAMNPWDYYAAPDKPSMVEQENLYKGFLQVWEKEDMVGGLIFWEWTLVDDDYDATKDGGYSPRGKPAEKVLRDYFKRACGPVAATSQPALVP
ncbi:MAG: hypothetical protein PHU85_02220 [Phycisphaerae bacterium]|nr:hypothetical protein [Phycisphaerae bacterium]